MLLDRRSALAGVLLLVVTIAGCDGAHSSTAQQATAPASTLQSSTAQSSTVQSAAAASSSASRPASSGPGTTAPATTSATVAPPPSVATVPAHLCSGTDAAQNAADAYLGALSAGNLVEALACVQPNTVPEALTRSLLATAAGTAVYLPRDGVDGPAVFGYHGNGKSIDVTVSKQPDGQFRVTKVAVRGG